MRYEIWIVLKKKKKKIPASEFALHRDMWFLILENDTQTQEWKSSR